MQSMSSRKRGITLLHPIRVVCLGSLSIQSRGILHKCIDTSALFMHEGFSAFLIPPPPRPSSPYPPGMELHQLLHDFPAQQQINLPEALPVSQAQLKTPSRLFWVELKQAIGRRRWKRVQGRSRNALYYVIWFHVLHKKTCKICKQSSPGL